MLLGLTGLGMAQPSPLDSLFGSVRTNTMSYALAGLGGLNTGLQSANGGNDLLQLAALLGGSQQQSVSVQPAQLLQVYDRRLHNNRQRRLQHNKLKYRN